MTKISSGRGRAEARRIALTAVALAALVPLAGAASAAGPERSLAGISIFAPGSSVTAKFGNPSRILVGGVAPSAASTAAGANGSGGSGGPSGGSSGYPGASPGGGSAGAGLLPGFGGVNQSQLLGGISSALGGSSSEFSGASSGYPGSGSSSGYPGSGSPGSGSSGYPGGGAAVAGPPPKQPVTLIYDRQYGGSLEFTISADKRVIQIRETGYNGAYGTARGIKLGVSYAQVVARYGYPENTYIQGSIISTDYKDTLHCGFQFLDQKLVGIIVASPD